MMLLGGMVVSSRSVDGSGKLEILLRVNQKSVLRINNYHQHIAYLFRLYLHDTGKVTIEPKPKGWPSQSDVAVIERRYSKYITGIMMKWGADCTVASLEDMYNSIIDMLIEFEMEYAGRVTR